MSEPVRHLQHFRARSLRVNAVCKQWASEDESGPHERDFQLRQRLHRTALVSWRVARVVTGWLNALPDRRCHPLTSGVGQWSRTADACIIAMTYAAPCRRLRWIAEQLDLLNHEAANIRAITASPDINEMLARHQPDLKSLRSMIREELLDAQAREAADAAADSPARAGVPNQETHCDEAKRERVFVDVDTGEWPYLSV